MNKTVNKKNHPIVMIPAQIYLWIAVLIFGASGSVTRLVTEIGTNHLIDGRNPISLCNVLFVGNVCAFLVLFPLYRSQWNRQSLKQLTWKNWSSLTIVAILSGALAPALFFLALSLTMVSNVVLIGRIEPPLVLALSVWLLRERVNSWEVSGSVVSLIGVIITVLFQGLGSHTSNGGVFHIGIGELATAAGALAAAIATIISKVQLNQIPLGIFTIFRLIVGTVVFFFFALLLYGKEHFMDVFSPILWQWMLIYSLVIVVFGQLCWFMGLRIAKASEVSLASSFTPIAGILAAYLILGEAPNLAQYFGGTIVVVGIFLSQIGGRRSSATESAVHRGFDEEMEMGFKGL